MADQTPRKSRVDAFSSFADVPGAGGRRRGRRWSLWPSAEPGVSAIMDELRLASEADRRAGIGGKVKKVGHGTDG
jgi:hypothetical protein